MLDVGTSMLEIKGWKVEGVGYKVQGIRCKVIAFQGYSQGNVKVNSNPVASEGFIRQ